jgi:hypothetical protein
MHVMRRVLSARNIRRTRRVRIAVRSEGSLTDVTGRLTAGRRVYASGRLKLLEGAGTLRMQLARRIPPGSYRLSLRGIDAAGEKVVLSLRMRMTR